MWKRHYPFPTAAEFHAFYNDKFPKQIFGLAHRTYPDVIKELNYVQHRYRDTHRFMIVTQQKVGNEDITYEWLKRKGCGINEFRFCSHIWEKLEGLDIIVDDNPAVLDGATLKGAIGISKRNMWNRHAKVIYSIDKIRDLVGILDEINTHTNAT